MIVFLMLSLLCVCVSADVGNFNDYDSDFGGDSYDWGSDSDYGDGGLFFFDGDGGFDFTDIIVIIIVIAVIVFIKSKAGKNSSAGMTGGTVPPKSVTPLPSNISDAVEAEIKKTDPDFTSEKMIGYSNEVFVKIQEAWTKKDWHIVRVFESEELFNTHRTQLQEYIDKKQTNVIERVCINNSYICGYQNDGTKERIEIFTEAVMNDYIVDDETQKVLKGNKDLRYTMRYRLEYIRSSGVRSGMKQQSVTNCPNCGAPTEITSSGQCEYCRSVITTGDHGWVLNRMQGIR